MSFKGKRGILPFSVAGQYVNIAALVSESFLPACVECKPSDTAPLTRNQKRAFPEIEKSGAVIVGKGKPGFPGGTVIPPTRVDILRPK